LRAAPPPVRVALLITCFNDTLFPGVRRVPLRPGDVVEVEIEGIGTLTNPVAAEPPTAT